MAISVSGCRCNQEAEKRVAREVKIDSSEQR